VVDGVYCYRICAFNQTGNSDYSNEACVTISDVKQLSFMPDDYFLSQNYPNPFNPSTKITFGIPSLDHVSIIVFDPIGNIVNELTSQYYSAGTYELVFEAGDLPSGIYFYTIKTSKFIETKKMLLLK